MQPLHWILWNLFLAAIPVGTAYLLAWCADTWTLRRKLVPWIAWLPLALVWLAFLPNTCYLLTEWRHFLFDNHFVAVRDAVENDRTLMLHVARQGLFFVAYSGFGVLCFTLSIRPIERLLRKAGVILLPLTLGFFFLTSLGVYMGLIVRLNSWDILTRPGYVLDVAIGALSNPLLLETIVVFAFLLLLAYQLVDVWIDGLVYRLHERAARFAGEKQPAAS